MGAHVNSSKYAKFPSYDRERYLKISLSESEMKVFDLKMKKISSHFKDKGVLLNQPEFFRIMFSNLDDPDFVNVILSLYQNEIHPMFKVS